MRKKLFFIILFFPLGAFGILPEDVVQSSLHHFPQVIEASQRVVQKSSELEESEGAFDIKLKGDVDTRTEGYYNGDAYKLSVEKPFPFLNSRIYGGKRQSYGNFPSYEGKFETLSEGEFFAGVSVSLLRNSLIDFNRYNLRLREENINQATANVDLMKINVQTMALKAYWMWLVKGYELKVYKNILKLAEKRAKQISRRIRAGDLARIYQTENSQYIRKRQAEVVNSELDFKKASFYLSLFYRDSRGVPKNVQYEELPPLNYEELPTIKGSLEVYKRAVSENLDLKILNSKYKQAKLDIRLGKNEMLPKVDVNFEWNQDQGRGPNQLGQDENRVMLSVEVPLQFRKGLGKKRAGEAKASQIDLKRRWAKEKLRVAAESLVLKLNSFAKIFKITKDEAALADKLAYAERVKFSRGASDLLMVNIREENLAKAQVKYLANFLKYQFIDADVKKVKVEFIAE